MKIDKIYIAIGFAIITSLGCKGNKKIIIENPNNDPIIRVNIDNKDIKKCTLVKVKNKIRPKFTILIQSLKNDTLFFSKISNLYKDEAWFQYPNKGNKEIIIKFYSNGSSFNEPIEFVMEFNNECIQ